ncbi:hypothetical protein HDU91_000334 [Kappamyces sp. JEL0680]|nr:hypothetical protein HDU91_000334 [Kappamyces sp. JEL0680]
MPSVTYKDVPYYYEGNESSKVGIICIQEWWGLNNHIKNMTSRLAKSLNALAITPDLYRGKVASAADEANHLMNNLNWPGAVEDIRHAAEWLRSKGVTKVGVTGFCMGGALSIAATVLVDSIDGGVCFYGIPPAALADPAKLQKPMQFHFGDKDHSAGFSDIAACDKLRDTLKAGKLDVFEVRHSDASFASAADRRKGLFAEFHRYADGDHAFMNEEAPAYPFNEALSKLAYQHMIEFFECIFQ